MPETKSSVYDPPEGCGVPRSDDDREFETDVLRKHLEWITSAIVEQSANGTLDLRLLDKHLRLSLRFYRYERLREASAA
jgi:hypothetical protein